MKQSIVTNKIFVFLMMFLMMLTAGCGGSDDDKAKSSLSNPLSGDARDCVNAVEALLAQKLHYNNEPTEKLMHTAVLAVHGNPWPLNETDANFGRYSKKALRERLRENFMRNELHTYLWGHWQHRLSYPVAGEIATAFADLVDMTKYDVTSSAKTVELDGEYQELDVHIEYPDIEQINQLALKKMNTALISKYGANPSGRDDADEIIADNKTCGFEKLSKLLEYCYNIDYYSPWTPAQHAELEEIIRDSYMSVLNDKNNLPIKTYDGKVHIAKRTNKGLTGYVFWDKDESLAPFSIDIWRPMFPVGSNAAALDLGADNAVKIAVRDARLDDSDARHKSMDVSLFVNNKTDADIELRYYLLDVYGLPLNWDWLSPNNDYVELSNQTFVLEKGTSKTVDWKLEWKQPPASNETTGVPYMFSVNITGYGDIYLPLNIDTAAKPAAPAPSTQSTQSTPTQSTQSNAATSTDGVEIAAGRQLGADDLRLGGIGIEDNVSIVLNKLGDPNSEDRSKSEEIIYHYGTTSAPIMDVTIKQNATDAWVGTIIALGSDVATPRGISPSKSALDNVMGAYGTGYKLSNYENLDLYEYDVTSKSGQPYILRFAIDRSNHRVDYISIRHK